MTLARLGGQLPLEIVHVYIYVPYTDAVAVDSGSVLLLKVDVPGPEVCVHTPVPTVGVFPPSDPLINDAQIF